jgi:hypothetical protein
MGLRAISLQVKICSRGRWRPLMSASRGSPGGCHYDGFGCEESAVRQKGKRQIPRPPPRARYDKRSKNVAIFVRASTAFLTRLANTHPKARSTPPVPALVVADSIAQPARDAW